jgi:hypothetical protein
MPTKKPDLPARLMSPGPGGQGAAKWVVTETGIKMVEDLTARGVTLTSIARVLGMDTATLRLVRARQPEVEEAYQRGLAREQEALVGNLRRAADEGNIVANIFLLKARHQYREGEPMEVNVNVKTGGVLVVPEREDLHAYIERLRREGELEGPGEMIDVTPARHDDAHPTKTRLAPAKVTRGD